MSVKPWSAFTTSLPDDQVEDGQDIVVFGGRNVAIAISELLTKLGCDVDEPYYAELDGWEFLLTYKERHRFWCRVISFHPGFHLLFEDPGGRARATKNAAAYAELALELAAALKSDPRFHKVTWWSLEEGPPEPDEIASAAVKRRAGEDPASPISTEGKEGGRPAWGCLALAVCMILSAALGSYFALTGAHWDSSGGEIWTCLLGFGMGFAGLFLAYHRRVED